MIQLIKLAERRFIKNGIYILKKLGDKILVNNRTGLMIFNLDLTLVNSINFPQDYTIYHSYTNSIGDQALIYCEENALIYYNITTNKLEIISDFNYMPSELCLWIDNIVILYLYSKLFCQFNTDALTLSKVNNNDIKSKYPEFYGFCNTVRKNYHKYQLNASNYSFIKKDEITATVTFVDYLNKKNIVAQYYPDERTHDIVYSDGFFVFIKEEYIIISNGDYKFKLNPKPAYEFLRAFFIKKENKLLLVILTSKHRNPWSNQILVFDVQLISNNRKFKDKKFNSLNLKTNNFFKKRSK